jgi:hypothetical protein
VNLELDAGRVAREHGAVADGAVADGAVAVTALYAEHALSLIRLAHIMLSAPPPLKTSSRMLSAACTAAGRTCRTSHGRSATSARRY